MRILVAIPLLLGAVPALADIHPMPTPESPRIQTAQWEQGSRTILTALPKTALTVMLDPTESIRRVTVGNDRSWEISVSPELNGLTVTPREGAQPSDLLVQTNAREYEFLLEVEASLLSAYLVRFGDAAARQSASDTSRAGQRQAALGQWSYQLRGDRSVMPASISDDGVKTTITYSPGQALPAVFAIGPTGEEEVVDGYMRNDEFMIDRVHDELVFRIDREKANARRNSERDDER